MDVNDSLVGVFHDVAEKQRFPRVRMFSLIRFFSVVVCCILTSFARESILLFIFVDLPVRDVCSCGYQEYLGGALVQVGLCKPPNPITSIRMNARFAFLEMRSAEDATRALNLDGIPFAGAALSVGRPKKVRHANAGGHKRVERTAD